MAELADAEGEIEAGQLPNRIAETASSGRDPVAGGEGVWWAEAAKM